MSYNALMFPKFKWFDSDGPAVGWKVYTYEPGTTTPKTSYQTPTGTANTNPVVLDSDGEADIYLDGSYKILVTDADDTTQWSLDNVQGAAVDEIIFSRCVNLAAIGTGTKDGEGMIDQATGNVYTWDNDNTKWRISSGNRYTTAGLPVSATYTIETGTFVMDTTTNGIKRWNGSAWVAAGSSGVLTTQGDILYASAANTLERLAKGTAGQMLTMNVGATAPEWVSRIDNQITGLILSRDTDTEHDTNITAGMCQDYTNVTTIELATEITKKIDAAWAVGDDQGGLDATESVAGTPDASTIYYVYLIKRSDTGIVDACYSENAPSVGPSCDGTPIPAAYDYYRCIGYVRTDSSANITPYVMRGDTIYFTQASLTRSASLDPTNLGSFTALDLTGYIGSEIVDSFLLGAQGSNAVQGVSFSIDGTNVYSGIAGANNPGDTVENAFFTSSSGTPAWLPVLAGDQIYIKCFADSAAALYILVMAVRLKYR